MSRRQGLHSHKSKNYFFRVLYLILHDEGVQSKVFTTAVALLASFGTRACEIM